MNDELNAANEVAKAVTEVAKTTSKAIDASKEFGSFLKPFIDCTLEQAIGIVEDKFKYARWKNQVRLMEKAHEYLRDKNLTEPSRIIPLKLAVPLLQAASIEDDNYLQDLWAKLLTNFANKDSGVDLQRSYIDILKRMNPLEVIILKKIYDLPYEEAKNNKLSTRDLPNDIVCYSQGYKSLDEKALNPEVELALANLARQGCISPAMVMSGGLVYTSIYQTYLGKCFYDACTLTK